LVGGRFPLAGKVKVNHIAFAILFIKASKYTGTEAIERL
jgi:hypothetical protein